MSAHDKAKWHYGGDYPDDLDESHAFIHTGFFLGWIVEKGLLDPEFEEDIASFGEELKRFKERDLSAPKLFECWDGAFVDDMITEDADAFTNAYFDFTNGTYLADYEELLSHDLPTMYHVQDTWENYDRIKARIEQRYQEWLAAR